MPSPPSGSSSTEQLALSLLEGQHSADFLLPENSAHAANQSNPPSDTAGVISNSGIGGSNQLSLALQGLLPDWQGGVQLSKMHADAGSKPLPLVSVAHTLPGAPQIRQPRVRPT